MLSQSLTQADSEYKSVLTKTSDPSSVTVHIEILDKNTNQLLPGIIKVNDAIRYDSNKTSGHIDFKTEEGLYTFEAIWIGYVPVETKSFYLINGDSLSISFFPLPDTTGLH